MHDKKGMDPSCRRGGKEFGGVERGKIVIRVYYVREESIFNKMEKRKVKFSC